MGRGFQSSGKQGHRSGGLRVVIDQQPVAVLTRCSNSYQVEGQLGFERVTHVLRVLIAASVTSSGQSASGRELALNLDIHNERRLLNHSSALMKVFVDRDCLLHDLPYEILSGKPVPYFESPARWHAIKHELESSPSFEIAECDSDIDVLGYAQAIHDRDYIQYLRNAYEDWVADGNDKARSQSLGWPSIGHRH